MYSKITIQLLFLILLFGCTEKKEKKIVREDQHIQSLIKEAENNAHPLKERLLYALQADSIANPLNAKEQLAVKRLVATLYFKIGNSTLAYIYFLKTAELAEQLSDFQTLGTVYNNLALVYTDRVQYDSALLYYAKARQIFQSLHDSLRIAQGIVNVGITYKNRGDFDVAYDTTLKAIPLLEALKSKKDLGTAYSTLANTQKEFSNYDISLKYHQLALKLRTEEKDSANIAGSLNNIGNIYLLQKEYKKAIAEYLEALAIKEKLGLPRCELAFFKSG